MNIPEYKTLLTGANGFVGTNISLDLLHKPGHKLFALDVAVAENKYFEIFYTWKNLQAINWNEIDIVIHLAGKAHDTSNTSNAQDYFDINVDLTKKIFDLFLTSGASKFIFFSSVKAVADTVSGAVLTEEIPPNPLTPYGQSKLAAEQYIFAQPLPADKKVYILRPCMIHGPGNKGNLNLLYKLAKKGLPWPLGAFKNSRSFTSIQNLQFVIRDLIEKDIEPGTYQLADDEPLSTNDLIQLMAGSFNKKAHIWNISPKIIQLMAKAGDRIGLPLNSERLKKLTESYVVSNQKLKMALGIEKMPYTSREGMKKTLASFS
ncbi:MAG: NAD-dependent epimerase/dehydratase family protein [Ferruginibacter sp.]|nr:NAD-dependent epimerase/dehydratase family protein [Ferruginibacter sp.]